MLLVYKLVRLFELFSVSLTSLFGNRLFSDPPSNKTDEFIAYPFDRYGHNHCELFASFSDNVKKIIRVNYSISGNNAKNLYRDYTTENHVHIVMDFDVNNPNILESDTINYSINIISSGPKITVYDNLLIKQPVRYTENAYFGKTTNSYTAQRPYIRYVLGSGTTLYYDRVITNGVNKVQTDKYDRFDIKDIHFKLEQPLDLPVDLSKIEPEAVLSNSNGFFSSLGGTDEPLINLPLNLALQEDGSIGVSFTNSFYVDRFSHLMYKDPGLNRLETETMYMADFIYGEASGTGGAFISIVLLHVGNANMNVIIRLYFSRSPESIFGYCASNDYCVTSKSSNPDFDIAKVVNYDA